MSVTYMNSKEIYGIHMSVQKLSQVLVLSINSILKRFKLSKFGYVDYFLSLNVLIHLEQLFCYAGANKGVAFKKFTYRQQRPHYKQRDYNFKIISTKLASECHFNWR